MYLSNSEPAIEDKRPLLSISIPVLNEEDSIEALYSRLKLLSTVMEDRCEFEFVFTDNHSDDATWTLLTRLAEKDQRIKAFRFSKNFGFQRSILFNLMHTKGDAVMQIDADLQDPPEMLESFYEQWKNGYHVVYGIRENRKENIFLNTFRRFGYWVIEKVSEHPIPRDAGDFRLIDRKVIESLVKIKTPNPYLRGMIAGLGFNQTGIPYDREVRTAGKSKFNLSRLIRLGITAIFNHSTIPLRLATLMGATILTVAFIGSMYYLFLKILQPDLPRGLASIHILVLFGIGLNSFLLGVIGEYLLNIYLVLRAEPVAIIEQSININQNEQKDLT